MLSRRIFRLVSVILLFMLPMMAAWFYHVPHTSLSPDAVRGTHMQRGAASRRE